jgi:GTP 3',8-cyclase
MLTDSFGRRIEYMRVSVTDRCNLRCTYCMPENGVPLLKHEEMLRFEETAAFSRVAVQEGIRSIRITGGEPLLKRGIAGLVRMLSEIPGLEDLSMTTNGVLLPGIAQELRGAGLKRVNIGLPSLDEATYASITRCAEPLAQRAIAGIKAALEAGLSPVKVNVVVMRGVNDDLTQFFELARLLAVEVRFIEYMPMGPLDEPALFVPASEILRKVREASSAPLVEVARALGRGPVRTTVRMGDSAGTVGVIPAMSEHFCARCNRLRLTSDGHLRTCLFSDDEIDLRPALRPTPDWQRVLELLREAVRAKPECMPPNPKHGRRLMRQVGG